MPSIQWPSARLGTRFLLPHPRVSLGSCTRAPLSLKRGYASRPPSSPTRYEPDPDPSSSPQNVQNEYIGHTMFAFNNLRKVLVYTGYGTLILGLATATAFEGAHFWIEREMLVREDEDARHWGWEVDGWTGGDNGGTSPALGFFGRHAVRAAWFSLRYGARLSGATAISQVGGSRETGNLNVVESGLESARVYLEMAMARIRDERGRVRADRVGLELLERHAAVLERIGTRAALAKAREEYTEVFFGRSGQQFAEARLAIKLGDLSERLGDDERALSWWARGIDLTKDKAPTTPATGSPTIPLQTIPLQPPSSPAAQRTLAAAMLSLSAYYSKRRQLKEAKHVQEHAIPLIETMVAKPEASPSTGTHTVQSSGQTLHHMYLLHRKCLLAIHHGEVTFALASSTMLPGGGSSSIRAALMDLLTAASSSEIVAQVLTGLPLSHPDLPSSYLNSQATSVLTPLAPQRTPHPPSSNAQLLPTYQASSALNAPAGSVLRDARLSAAEAWDLCGILYSDWESAEADLKALECFERALGWVGDPGQSESRDGMGVNKWRSLWGRYVEAREKVIKGTRSKAK